MIDAGGAAGAEPVRVALTGNVASGKSTVVRVWRRLGIPVIEADALARRAVEPGSPALQRIVDAFGPAVLDAQGGLDRAAMRRMVFRDTASRRRLESIVHPEIRRLRDEEEAVLRRSGARVVAHEIPLLFELDMQDAYDWVVFVDAPEPVRLERLIRDRGLDEAEARRIMAAQSPAAEKRDRADLVIVNDGSLDQLEIRARAACERILSGRTARG